jgi:hypothetical protein
MAIHRVVLTHEDYLAMPDDGRRDEILTCISRQSP